MSTGKHLGVAGTDGKLRSLEAVVIQIANVSAVVIDEVLGCEFCLFLLGRCESPDRVVAVLWLHNPQVTLRVKLHGWHTGLLDKSTLLAVIICHNLTIGDLHNTLLASAEEVGVGLIG